MLKAVSILFLWLCTFEDVAPLRCMACATVGSACRFRVAECPHGKDVCIGLYDRPNDVLSFGCSTRTACQRLMERRRSRDQIYAFCCGTDLCNGPIMI